MRQNKSIILIILGTLAILLVPLLAMQFTDEVDWGVVDFIVAGALLLSVGFSYKLLAKKVRNTKQRAVIVGLLITVLVLIWVELAVGIFGTPFSGS